MMRVARLALLALFLSVNPLSPVLAQNEFQPRPGDYVVDPISGEYVEWIVSEPVDPASTAWELLIWAIELIRSDPAAASLEAADWWCDPFDILAFPPDGLEREAQEIEAFLTSFVRTSTDDWLVDRIAYSLAECTEEAWSPMFMDLLGHPSIQIRWRAVQHFAFIEEPDAVPALEALWNESLPAWIRTDLADALLENGSSEHAEDCVDLVDSDDLELARSALRTLSVLRPPGALGLLSRFARQTESPLREEATSALEGWSDHNEVARLLVDLSRSEVGAMKYAAVAALYRSSQPEAVKRLVEVVSDSTADSSLRLGALRAISDSDRPELIRVLSEVLDEPTRDDTLQLQQDARDGLSRLGVDIPLPDAPTDEVTTTVTISCAYTLDLQGTIPQPLDGNSVRCWAAPGIESDPEETERLEAGLPVDLNDHFQSGDEHWILVDDEDCWIPFDQLDDSIEDWEVDPDWPYRHEFDVWLEEIDSSMGQALLAEGMIRVFDIGDTVAAIEFTIDPDDREAVVRLAEIYVNDESEMSYYVWDAMDELEDRYEHDAELGEKIARALGD